MTDAQIIDAFLREEAAENAHLYTDGEFLFAGDALVAEWTLEGLRVDSTDQGGAREQVKDALIHAVLFQMALHEIAGGRVAPALAAEA